MKRAYYSNDISRFLVDAPSSILGLLSKAHDFTLEEQQKNAWVKQIEILQTSLQGIPGHVYFEYSIPRVGKRVDLIVISGNALFSIEFKVGSSQFDSYAADQAMDYALDLKNFHEGSHQIDIFPVLVATEATHTEALPSRFDDGVWSLTRTNSQNLSTHLQALKTNAKGPEIDLLKWDASGYKPTPTIVEAAKALYSGHQVEEISRSDAGATNLSITSAALKKIIDESISQKKKTICLVTGVPGAGKTLVGLDLATSWNNPVANQHAVLLSGNGPLVEILQEALAKDEANRSKASSPVKLSAARAKAKSFIQNIHHFRDEGLRTDAPPPEKVVIFDEAQRAWNKTQTTKFMKTKKGVADFDHSEPEYLIKLMDRHADWAVIICLVGGGQEINTGEAGISEWLDAIHNKFPHWQVCLPSTTSSADIPNIEKFVQAFSSRHHVDKNLHLTASVRSFRSERVSDFMSALLDKDIDKAKALYSEIKEKYPIKLTRSLEEAKLWLKEKSRGNERYGILASSGAGRLKAHGLDVKSRIEPVNWFLNDKKDVRSSFFMEDVATEFHVQGLELDWTCVAWDIDFILSLKKETKFRSFAGTKWNNIKSSTDQSYLKNKYRVLLTRARQGLVLFVPKGDPHDGTRPPGDYEELFSYLQYILND
ncbi:DUF2075 domain-containing protein [Bdellovibrio bacteriovorus]|uniref:Schlafen group 3-like DNA/RNA helicase domain-containing protein n=1 Tax=Bdellovibrio bacteriovorus (strain ATCC 15356 / DSM 50701 / NCIMB 9529 / HD100) TaxID=264462 RepID=Q6MJU2_BDEBA|nr:DUF2075 domain-containing protein [Bdellovibrio bacteriovorus]CAE80467.1 hypothetical protein predicted by Glimmer/Critica [Bdellovibrio bacteriovorus HD100]